MSDEKKSSHKKDKLKKDKKKKHDTDKEERLVSNKKVKNSSSQVDGSNPPNENEYKTTSYSKSDDQLKTSEVEDEPKVVFKPNFSLTGMLAKDKATGNAINGVPLKFNEPLDSATPIDKWRIYVFKDDKAVETLHIHRKSWFIFGRDTRVADVTLLHPSCSLQHAVIQYRSKKIPVPPSSMTFDRSEDHIIKIIPYIMDLMSTHKTTLNGKEIEGSRYYELRSKDVIKFGVSTREYVIMNDYDQDEDT